MDRSSFLQLLTSDGQLLRDTARGDLTASVPPCPGWTVRDVVEHTAQVYEHKIVAIGLGGAQPDPWPPTWPQDRDPVEWFADAHARLLDRLTTTDPAAPSWTWWAPDQSVGFWVRRMAQETAVHRTDVQSAFGAVTPVDQRLAVDGVDEILHVMLAGDWSADRKPGPTAGIEVAADERSWLVELAPDHVTITDLDEPVPRDRAQDPRPEARVSGGPSELLLWMWGRSPMSTVRVEGDQRVVERLRQRLALATQ